MKVCVSPSVMPRTDDPSQKLGSLPPARGTPNVSAMLLAKAADRVCSTSYKKSVFASLASKLIFSKMDSGALH